MNTSIDTLLFLDQFVSRYCLAALFLLGVIGSVLSTIIFTKRTFRNTSCVLYFLGSTIANYPIIYVIIPARFLADGFNLDPSKTISSFCKYREYLLTVSRSLSAWFIVFASFDRFMSSSRNIHHRQFCHIHIARRMIALTVVFALLFYIHIPIIFINHVQRDQCEAPFGTYRIFNDCSYSIGYIIVPALLMLIFGVLTINNQRRRPGIIPAFQSLHIIKRDRNLFLMLIFQFILFICTTIPYAVQKLYITMTTNESSGDAGQSLSSDLWIHAIRMISFINHSCQFYIFILSSKLFRQELIKSLLRLLRLRPQPVTRIVTIRNNQIDLQLSRQVSQLK